MPDDQLDALPTEQLHDLAVSRARHHLDVKFFWNLMKVLPAAEIAAGEPEEAEADLQSMVSHIDDVTESGRGEVGELLRPFYVEYLRKHGVTGG
jgi:hypothetical protein